jgi:hypothetical protein
VYELEARWTSDENRSNLAVYQVVLDGGSVISTSNQFDQTTGGGQWTNILTFNSPDTAVSIRLSSAPDGYVIADAVRLVPDLTSEAKSINVTGSKQSVVLEDPLIEGTWKFEVRAVDKNGLVSDFSEPVTVTYP